MQKDSEALAAFLRGKKVAFIGAGVSHKTLIGQFCAMGAEVTLCVRAREKLSSVR